MPEEGNVQVAIKGFQTTTAGTFDSGAVIIELGARGQAVEMIALHHTLGIILTSLGQYNLVGLSTNPEHELAPPEGVDLFLKDSAVYGVSNFSYNGVGTNFARSERTNIIPLYGLIRPRRQVLVWLCGNTDEIPTDIRVEIYYRPIELNKVDLDALNLKYGKYRRYT